MRDGDATDPAVFGQIDASSSAIPEAGHLAVPRMGATSPLNHSTTYTRHGLDWMPFGDEADVANGFTATLQNLAAADLDVARMARTSASR